MRFFLALLVAALTLPLQAGERPAMRVLFIGNSLTYANDLPAMVRRLGAIDRRPMVVESVALPNYSLEDHLGPAGARQVLAHGPWDIVVLQQGPSSLDESRRQLIRDAKAFAALIRPARVAILMVWPPRSRWAALPNVAEAHRLAAVEVGGALIPAGTAMQAALARDPRLALLASDGFHPELLGTYLAALAVYETIAGPLPPRLRELGMARRVAGKSLRATESQLTVVLDAVRQAVRSAAPGS